MMLAVMDCVNDNGPPPPALSMALDCRQWGTLPEPGGWRDQYPQEMYMMNVCINIYDVWHAFKRAQREGRTPDFLSRNPEADTLIGRILDLDRERQTNG